MQESKLSLFFNQLSEVFQLLAKHGFKEFLNYGVTTDGTMGYFFDPTVAAWLEKGHKSAWITLKYNKVARWCYCRWQDSEAPAIRIEVVGHLFESEPQPTQLGINFTNFN